MKVGRKVRIANHYLDDKYNPRNMDGIIISIDGKMNPIIVLWENGIRNSYSEKSLQIV